MYTIGSALADFLMFMVAPQSLRVMGVGCFVAAVLLAMIGGVWVRSIHEP